MRNVREFTILTKKNRLAFLPGEILKGELYICLQKPVPIRSLKIVLYGDGEGQWLVQSGSFQARGGGKKKVLVDVGLLVFGYADNEEKPEIHDRGRFVYDFEFNIPENLPISFKSPPDKNLGYARYFLKAVLSRPNKRDKVKKFNFVINELIDPDRPELAFQPGSYEEKNVRAGLVPCGSLALECYLNRSQYIQGQSIFINTIAQNKSSKIMKEVYVKLIRRIRCKSRCGVSTFMIDTTSLHESRLGPYGKFIWTNKELKIPAIGPTFTRSDEIRVDYIVRIGMYEELGSEIHLDLPVIIGTMGKKEGETEHRDEDLDIYDRKKKQYCLQLVKADERDQFRKSLHKKVVKKSDLRPNMKPSIDEINTAIDDEKVFGSFDDEEEFIINEKIIPKNGRNIVKYPNVDEENRGNSCRISDDVKNETVLRFNTSELNGSSLPTGKNYNLPGTKVDTVLSVEPKYSVITDQDESLTSDTPRSEEKKNGDIRCDNKNVKIISKLNCKPVEEVVIESINLNSYDPEDLDNFVEVLDDKNKHIMIGKKGNDETLHNDRSEYKDNKYTIQLDPVSQRKSSSHLQQSLIKNRVTGSTGSLNNNTGSLNKSLGLLSNSTASLTDKRPSKKCTGILNKSVDSLTNKELNLPVKSSLKKNSSQLNNSMGSLSKREPGFSSSLPLLNKSVSDGIGSSIVRDRVFSPKLSLQKNADLCQLNNKIIISNAETSKHLKSISHDQQEEKQANNDNQLLTGNQNEKETTNPWYREVRASSNELLINESVDKDRHQDEGYYWKEVVDSEGEMFSTPPQERKQIIKLKNKIPLQKNQAQIENDPDIENQTNGYSKQELKEMKKSKRDQQTFQENAHKNSQEAGSKVSQEEKVKNISTLNLFSDGKFPIENNKESKSCKTGSKVFINPEDTIENSEKKTTKNEERKNSNEKKGVPAKSFSDELNKELNAGFFEKIFSKPKHEVESKLNITGESRSIEHEGKTSLKCNEKQDSTNLVLKTQTYQEVCKKETINEDTEPRFTIKTSIKKEEKNPVEENCEGFRIKTKSVFFEINDGMTTVEKQKTLNNRMSNKLINPKDNQSKLNYEIAEKFQKHSEDKGRAVEKTLINDFNKTEGLICCPKENKKNQDPAESKSSPKKITKGNLNKTETSPFKVNKLKQDGLLEKNKTFKQEVSKNLPVLDNQSINIEKSQEHKLKIEPKQLTSSQEKNLEKVHSLSPIKIKPINTKVSIQNEKQTLEDAKPCQLRKIKSSNNEPPCWESIRRPIYQAHFSKENCFIPNSELDKEPVKTRSHSEIDNNSPDGVKKKNTEKKQPKTQIAFGRTIKVNDQKKKPNPNDTIKKKKPKFTQQQRLSSCGLLRKGLSESARKDSERKGILDDKNEQTTSLSELKYSKEINSPSKTAIYSKNKNTITPESVEKKYNFFHNQKVLEKCCPSNFCSSSMLDMEFHSRTKNKAEYDNFSQPDKVNSLQNQLLLCSYDLERKVDKFSRGTIMKEEELEEIQNEVLANGRVSNSNLNARPVAYRLVKTSSGNIAANKRPDARVVTNKVRSCAKGGNKKEGECNRNLSGKKQTNPYCTIVNKNTINEKQRASGIKRDSRVIANYIINDRQLNSKIFDKRGGKEEFSGKEEITSAVMDKTVQVNENFENLNRSENLQYNETSKLDSLQRNETSSILKDWHKITINETGWQNSCRSQTTKIPTKKKDLCEANDKNPEFYLYQTQRSYGRYNEDIDDDNKNFEHRQKSPSQKMGCCRENSQFQIDWNRVPKFFDSGQIDWHKPNCRWSVQKRQMDSSILSDKNDQLSRISILPKTKNIVEVKELNSPKYNQNNNYVFQGTSREVEKTQHKSDNALKLKTKRTIFNQDFFSYRKGTKKQCGEENEDVIPLRSPGGYASTDEHSFPRKLPRLPQRHSRSKSHEPTSKSDILAELLKNRESLSPIYRTNLGPIHSYVGHIERLDNNLSNIRDIYVPSKLSDTMLTKDEEIPQKEQENLTEKISSPRHVIQLKSNALEKELQLPSVPSNFKDLVTVEIQKSNKVEDEVLQTHCGVQQKIDSNNIPETEAKRIININNTKKSHSCAWIVDVESSLLREVTKSNIRASEEPSLLVNTNTNDIVHKETMISGEMVNSILRSQNLSEQAQDSKNFKDSLVNDEKQTKKKDIDVSKLYTIWDLLQKDRPISLNSNTKCNDFRRKGKCLTQKKCFSPTTKSLRSGQIFYKKGLTRSMSTKIKIAQNSKTLSRSRSVEPISSSKQNILTKNLQKTENASDDEIARRFDIIMNTHDDKIVTYEEPLHEITKTQNTCKKSKKKIYKKPYSKFRICPQKKKDHTDLHSLPERLNKHHKDFTYTQIYAKKKLIQLESPRKTIKTERTCNGVSKTFEEGSILNKSIQRTRTISEPLPEKRLLEFLPSSTKTAWEEKSLAGGRLTSYQYTALEELTHGSEDSQDENEWSQKINDYITKIKEKSNVYREANTSCGYYSLASLSLPGEISYGKNLFTNKQSSVKEILTTSSAKSDISMKIPPKSAVRPIANSDINKEKKYTSEHRSCVYAVPVNVIDRSSQQEKNVPPTKSRSSIRLEDSFDQHEKSLGIVDESGNVLSNKELMAKNEDEWILEEEKKLKKIQQRKHERFIKDLKSCKNERPASCPSALGPREAIFDFYSENMYRDVTGSETETEYTTDNDDTNDDFSNAFCSLDDCNSLPKTSVISSLLPEKTEYYEIKMMEKSEGCSTDGAARNRTENETMVSKHSNLKEKAE